MLLIRKKKHFCNYNQKPGSTKKLKSQNKSVKKTAIDLSFFLFLELSEIEQRQKIS